MDVGACLPAGRALEVHHERHRSLPKPTNFSASHAFDTRRFSPRVGLGQDLILVVKGTLESRGWPLVMIALTISRNTQPRS